MRSPFLEALKVISSDIAARFSIQSYARLALSPPASPDSFTVLALHGYGQSPEILLPLTRRLFGKSPAIAALQAPFPFYDRLAPDGQTVYHWGTRHHWDDAVRIHHDLVSQSLAWVHRETGHGPQRCVLLGFSQPVGLNYRYAGTHPAAVRGVIGICGGVPSRWETDPYQPITAALLHISRSEDEVYPVEQAQRFPDRLRLYAPDVEFHLLPGGHRFPSQAGPLVHAWLHRLGLAPHPRPEGDSLKSDEGS